MRRLAALQKEPRLGSHVASGPANALISRVTQRLAPHVFEPPPTPPPTMQLCRQSGESWPRQRGQAATRTVPRDRCRTYTTVYARCEPDDPITLSDYPHLTDNAQATRHAALAGRPGLSNPRGSGSASVAPIAALDRARDNRHRPRAARGDSPHSQVLCNIR